MSTATTTVVSPKTIHMGVTPASIDIATGDTLVFSNNSTIFPEFEVVFLKSPNGSDLTFTGTTQIKILVTEDGTFNYSIRHLPTSGPAVVTGAFSVRSCTGGCK
jgi:plastocyanin